MIILAFTVHDKITSILIFFLMGYFKLKLKKQGKKYYITDGKNSLLM